MKPINKAGYYSQQVGLDKFKKQTNQLQNKNIDKNKQEKKLYKACQDFEAIFTKMMFSQMRKSVPESKLIDGGQAEEIFEDMLDEKIAEQASQKNGSMAELLYQQLRLQLDNE